MQDNLNFEEILRSELTALEAAATPQQAAAPTAGKQPVSLVEASANSEYTAWSTDVLPAKHFYPKGTILYVRAAKVSEIQHYSMVDNDNFVDVIDKINAMLSACVKIKHPNGKMGTYLDLRESDAFYLLFLIRDLTFQKKNKLSVTAKCACGAETNLEIGITSMVHRQINEKYAHKIVNGRYEIKTKTGETYHFAPPTIGLQKSFMAYVYREKGNKRDPNLSFLKIMATMFPEKNNMSLDEIDKNLEWFTKMENPDLFYFLNDFVEQNLQFGVLEIKGQCGECGNGVAAPFTFPFQPNVRVSDVFVPRDVVSDFIVD